MGVSKMKHITKSSNTRVTVLVINFSCLGSQNRQNSKKVDVR